MYVNRVVSLIGLQRKTLYSRLLWTALYAPPGTSACLIKMKVWLGNVVSIQSTGLATPWRAGANVYNCGRGGYQWASRGGAE